MLEPVVSVIIINWNHRHCIIDCLDSLLAQEYSELEVIVVDNGSIDGSTELIRQNYPTVNVIAYTENHGFAQAFNNATRISNGSFVLSLNPDVTLKPGFISHMVRAIKSDARIGMVAPKLLQAWDSTLLDSTGLFIDQRRRTYDRGQGSVDSRQYDSNNQVFGACGAAALYRRSMLEDLKVGDQFFDEDFFAYYEDADLAWRAQWMGWGCVYVPEAVGLHIRGYGDTLLKRRIKNHYGPRFALRNRYLMILKNDDFRGFLHDLPLILFTEIPRWLYLVFVSPRSLLGIVDFIRLIPPTWKKRQEIRAVRRTQSADLRHWFTVINFR
jgi:GT2 family glycosyltransferase